MKRLLVLFVLLLFSSMGYSSTCPDGSQRIQTISDDGSYFLFNECVRYDSSSSSSSSSSSVVIPKNAKASGSNWVCLNGYYRVENTCQRIPANGYHDGNSLVCKTGYELNNTKNTCRVILIVPANASKSINNYGVLNWTCNKNYYKKLNTNTCIKVPKNSTSSSLSNYFKCNTGYKKSDDKCIKKKNKLVVPSYRN